MEGGIMPAENEQQTELLTPTDLQIIEFQKTLGTGASYSMDHLFQCFEMSIWVKDENSELTKNALDDLIQAKNILLRQIVLNQIETEGQFKIVAPFDNTCTKCGGSGELYKFKRSSQRVTCMKCKKPDDLRDHLISLGNSPEQIDGFKVITCPSCDGTSRFTKNKKDEPCKTCNGKYLTKDSESLTQVLRKCETCRGKMKVKKFAINPELKSTTKCRYCSGKGFFIPKPESLPDNPAINSEIADQLKEKIPNLGEQIKSS